MGAILVVRGQVSQRVMTALAEWGYSTLTVRLYKQRYKCGPSDRERSWYTYSHVSR